MKVVLRTAAAFGLMFLLSELATAKSLGQVTATSAEWSDPFTLPSATANSAAVNERVAESEASVQLVSCDDCCSDSYDDCCCNEPVSCECGSEKWGVGWGCEPMWVASAGSVFLHRSRPDPAPIMTPPTGTPGVLLNASDFGFGWDVGPDVSLMRRTASGYIIEGRYFNDRDSDASFRIPQVTTFRVAGIGVTILGGGSINSYYSTKLDSTELNLHAPVGSRLTLLSGFRWVELHDYLRSDIATPNSFVSWNNDNHMYGGQIGATYTATRPTNPLKVVLTGKAGLYANDANNEFRSNIVGSASDQDTAASFVGEVNLTTSYRLTQHIALKGGYQVLWLDNVALASEAAPGTVQAAGGTRSSLSTDGRVWYNGALAGVEFIW